MEGQPRDFPNSSGPKRMLFVELLGGIGDLMVALPSIHALARSNSQAQLEVVTLPQCSPLLQSDPLVSRVHVVGFENSSAEGTGSSLGEDVERILNSGSYDVVVSDTVTGGIERAVESSTARIRVANLWRDPLPDQLVEERFLAILAQEGLIDPHCVSLVGRISLTPEEVKWARCWRGNNLLERHQTVILNPTAGLSVKNWAPENFITLGRWLNSRHHCNIVILSGDQLELADTIAQGVGKGATILAKGGIRQLAAIASLSSLIVSADAALARVAAGAGARAVVLFGPLWAGRHGLRPPHVNIRSPRECRERNHVNFAEQGCLNSDKCVLDEQDSCVNDIAPEVVMRASERLLHS